MAIILCDIDGTLLVKTRPDPPGVTSPKRAAINQALAEVCLAPGVDFTQGLQHGLTDWQISERAVQRLRPSARIEAEAWLRICARAADLFAPGAASGEPLYERLPGVPEILCALQAAGHILGLVTGNLAVFAFFKLDQAGIARRFFTGPAAFGDHGRERSDILRAALAQIESRDGQSTGDRVPALRVIVLGDTAHDLAGARAVGLPFLGTGAMGLRREQILGQERPACQPAAAWVPHLGDAASVLEAIAGLTRSA